MLSDELFALHKLSYEVHRVGAHIPAPHLAAVNDKLVRCFVVVGEALKTMHSNLKFVFIAIFEKQNARLIVEVLSNLDRLWREVGLPDGAQREDILILVDLDLERFRKLSLRSVHDFIFYLHIVDANICRFGDIDDKGCTLGVELHEALQLARCARYLVNDHRSVSLCIGAGSLTKLHIEADAWRANQEPLVEDLWRGEPRRQALSIHHGRIEGGGHRFGVLNQANGEDGRVPDLEAVRLRF